MFLIVTHKPSRRRWPGRSALGLALAALALAAPAADASTRSVAVAVAANLKPAFEEVAARFRSQNPGVEVRATYGASGAFFAQIANGAPFDLFLSADADFPAKLAARGLTAGEPFIYACGKLVAWVPRGSPLDFEKRGLAALADPSVKKIAIADPDLAPYGRAAAAALEKAGFYPRLRDRIVLGQSVAQAAQFAESGNAQVGFIPLSLAKTPPLSDGGRFWLVPASSYPRIEQAGVVLAGAKQAALARELAAFVAGEGARDILERHGYDPPAR